MRKDAGMVKSDQDYFAKLIAKRIKKIIDRTRKKQKSTLRDESHILELNQQIESRVKTLHSAQKKVEKNDGNLSALVDLSANRLLYDNDEVIDAARELCEPKEMAAFLKEEWPQNRPQIVEVYYKDNVFRPKGHMYQCFYFYYSMLYKGRIIHCETQLLHVDMQESERLSHITYKNMDSHNAKVRAGTNTPTDDITNRGFIESLVTQNIHDSIRTGLYKKIDPELLDPNSELVKEIKQNNPEHFHGLNKLHETLADLKMAEAARAIPSKREAASSTKKQVHGKLLERKRAGEAVPIHRTKKPGLHA
jgi:hypothetical protein